MKGATPGGNGMPGGGGNPGGIGKPGGGGLNSIRLGTSENELRELTYPGGIPMGGPNPPGVGPPGKNGGGIPGTPGTGEGTGGAVGVA